MAKVKINTYYQSIIDSLKEESYTLNREGAENDYILPALEGEDSIEGNTPEEKWDNLIGDNVDVTKEGFKSSAAIIAKRMMPIKLSAYSAAPSVSISAANTPSVVLSVPIDASKRKDFSCPATISGSFSCSGSEDNLVGAFRFSGDNDSIISPWFPFQLSLTGQHMVIHGEVELNLPADTTQIRLQVQKTSTATGAIVVSTNNYATMTAIY